ncbi:protein phosphatase [Streptomyces sp. F001]|uniref:ATP-binding SpoIIE family protein phosphatase n=1 Tax=Streptomyces sp. F001 TaxID=1510026 RepID=UPI00101E45EB|nr:ATP-binding SpoIIE family protein phosphatase [Streptomyces sp. F001]RZB13475.1 protein phosphatase [Streptomyces sp. F001]
MGAIPAQRETVSLASDVPAHAFDPPAYEGGPQDAAQMRATLHGGPLAPGAARGLLRVAFQQWAGLGLPGVDRLTDRLAHDAMVVVSELVTNAVVHAGTDVELVCCLQPESGAVVVEVCDHHPSRAPRDGESEAAYEAAEYGRGLRLVAALSEAWGVTYRRGAKTVWARVSAEGSSDADALERAGFPGAELLAPEPHRSERDRDWLGRGALSFLAEASDLLAGQLDEDLVAALTGQLIVPRLADWCAVWLEDEALGGRGGWGDGTGAPGPRLARVWHSSEERIEELRRCLEQEPPRSPDGLSAGPVVYPWPGEGVGVRGVDGAGEAPPVCGAGGTGEASTQADSRAPGGWDVVSGAAGGAQTGEEGRGAEGAALAYRLVAGGRPLGTLVIGRVGVPRFPDEITGLVEDLSRRVALAIGAARQYARQATISAVLQRGLLPGAVAEIPGVRSALVYEPCDKGGPSGDFYDLFPAGDGRWCFAVGDVQGKGPEAAVVIGLARPWLRLLAREGYRVADVLDRLNQLLLDDATEAADAAARALVGPIGPGDGPQTRFLSLLYGELVPFDGGVRCTLASAGHPLPLLLGPDGDVRTVAQPQTLLGVVEDETYTSETFELRPGDSLLCVTDGVTERRCGSRQFDDGDGLATALAGCRGLSAELIAERIKRLVHEFGGRPPEDDLALLVLQAE